MKYTGKKKTKYALLCSILAVCLSGCGEGRLSNQPEVTMESYNKVAYEYYTVTKGDITPVMKWKLTGDDYSKESYYPFKDALEVKEVNCVRGDMVKAGDVLVRFKSGDLEDQMKVYQSRIEEDNLLLEHYQNLAAIDSSNNYSKEIEEIKKDLTVQQMYLQEANATLESYQIVAKGNGVVNFVSERLGYGTVDSTDMVITITYGTGGYVVDTEEDISFLRVGDVFEATFGSTGYDMVLSEIEDLGDGNSRVHFKLNGDENRLLETNMLNMTVERPTLKDVIYVPDSAVIDVEGICYVYVLDENGFRHGREVTVSSSVDGYTVITSGLSEGEKVVTSNE